MSSSAVISTSPIIICSMTLYSWGNTRFGLLRRLSAPTDVTSIIYIIGTLLTSTSDEFTEMKDLRKESFEKTEMNWLFRALAFSAAEVSSLVPYLRESIQCISYWREKLDIASSIFANNPPAIICFGKVFINIGLMSFFLYLSMNHSFEFEEMVFRWRDSSCLTLVVYSIPDCHTFP